MDNLNTKCHKIVIIAWMLLWQSSQQYNLIGTISYYLLVTAVKSQWLLLNSKTEKDLATGMEHLQARLWYNIQNKGSFLNIVFLDNLTYLIQILVIGQGIFTVFLLVTMPNILTNT